MRVVIADDNIKLADGIKKLIERNFPELDVEHVFYSGNALMNHLDKSIPDILITDILMPGYSGLDACKRIREASQDTQIIIITGYAEFTYAQQAIRYNVCELITKPYDITILKDAIAKAIVTPVLSLVTYFSNAIQDVSVRNFLKTHSVALHNFSHRQLLFLLDETKKKLQLDCNPIEMIKETPEETLTCFAEQYYILNPNASLTRRAKQYIRENFHDINLSRGMVAEYLATSTSNLSRIFNSECSMGISEYITKIRLEEAKKLLINSHLTIQQIAMQTGFNTDKYFTQVFKDNLGITPTQYQKVKANEDT